ncbi:MAG TPA: S41 family peptidase, partial [Gemmatimonadales bacterium]|nr:S41 family peptidase [Gemmatimonadales bacterium]
ALPSEASIEAKRLVGLARVWGHVKYFHPALAYRSDVDWDSALVAAIPRVRAAQTSSEYATAVQMLLRVLGDPLTRVLTPRTETRAATPNTEFGHRLTDDGILFINAGEYGALFAPSVPQVVERIQSAYRDARAVVIDLRSRGPTDAYARFQLTYAFSGLESLLTTEPLDTPGEWYRVHTGYESEGPFSSGQYQTGVFIRRGRRVTPSTGSRGIPIVFVLNEHAGILPITVPLQLAGHARIVFEGDLAQHTVGETVEIALPDGVTVQVRRSESVLADGMSAAFRPDAVVPASADQDGDSALARALQMARTFAPSRVDRERLPAAIAPPPDRAYPEMRYPSLEYRLLAAFRIWNTILYFYPYKELLDYDWDTVLGEHLSSFVTAQDAGEYARAVAAMAGRIQDSHAYLAGTLVTEELLGTGYPPIRVRMIEDTPVVTALYEGTPDGIAIGDIVVAVDGVPAADRLTETARFLAASTPLSLLDRAAHSFMNGPPGSRVTLTLRDVTNREWDVVLERRHEDYSTLYHRERQGPVMRILPGNIGYVDLDRLPLGDVDRMFTLMAGTAGIIFDMRGYPQGTIWRIAPWLARDARTVARFETPLVGYPAPEPGSLAFVQTVEPERPGQVGYQGPTVMLIDERTMSQAEHAGLYLLAANDTRLVGSRSAGANGEITTFTLPGGITVGFTGQAVTHADGRQLQRIGLIPDIEVRPTIGGVRAGVDEVLHVALQHLRGQP